MKPLAIAGVNLRRLFRDRSTYFFFFALPLLLILVTGLAFGGAYRPHLGVVDHGGGPLASAVVAALEKADLQISRVGDEATLRGGVEHGELSGGLVIPAGYDQAVRFGGQVALRYLTRPDQQAIGQTVRAVIGEQAARLRAAQFATRQAGVPFDRALGAADAAAPHVSRVTVSVTTVGKAIFPTTLGRFDIGASAQLLVFTFLTSLMAGIQLIDTRRLGVSRRMLTTPTSTMTILFGEALSRIAVALVQGVFIMVGTFALFGVNWGDPLGAGAILLAFCLVAAAGGLLVGSVLTTEQQAVTVGLLLGLGLAAIGGAMVPLELFTGAMRTIAHITPHAWASDAFATLVRRGGGLVDVLPEVGVLLAYAAALFLLGTWRLRKALTR